MKAKNGISLIVLVITIVVIIILAAAVILSLGQNNPINNSKVATLTQARDNIESAVQIYLSNEFTRCQGDYTSEQILKGVATAVEPSTYTVTALVTTTGADANLTGDFYKIDTDTAKTKLGIDIPTNAQTWYLNVKSGKTMVKVTGDPAYIFVDGDNTKDIVDTLSGFVTK